mmetsp:Transcript_2858/g.17766  ORF Transcript_2858/g.17766 Transcript_2858/m.17766 type:complete len:841 (-) Transcript_2858:292-2814(-)
MERGEKGPCDASDALRAWLRATGTHGSEAQVNKAYKEMASTIACAKEVSSACLAWMPVFDGLSDRPRTKTVATTALHNQDARTRIAAANVVEATFSSGGKSAFFAATTKQIPRYILDSENNRDKENHGAGRHAGDGNSSECVQCATSTQPRGENCSPLSPPEKWRPKNATQSSSALSSPSARLGSMFVEMHAVAALAVSQESEDDVLVAHGRWIQAMIKAAPYGRLPPGILKHCLCAIMRRFDRGKDPVHVACTLLACVEAAGKASGGKEDFCSFLHSSNTFQIMLELSKGDENSAVACSALQALQSASACFPSLAFEHSAAVLEIVERSLAASHPSPAQSKFANEALKVVIEMSKACVVAPHDDAVVGARSDHTEISLSSTANLGQKRNCNACLASEHTWENVVPIAQQHRLWQQLVDFTFPLAIRSPATMLHTSAMVGFCTLHEQVFVDLGPCSQNKVVATVTSQLDPSVQPSVRAAACRAMGVLVSFSVFANRLSDITKLLITQLDEEHVSVRIMASWALANLCNALNSGSNPASSIISLEFIEQLADALVAAARGNDKVRANVVRGVGYLVAFYVKLHPAGTSYPPWLPYCFDALLSAVTTGNVKVQWNGCYALGTVLGCSEVLHVLPYAVPSATRILMLLVRDCLNFKIRMHAASALGVPTRREDFAETYPDVLLVLTSALETIDAEDCPSTAFLGGIQHQTTYADIKYKPMLRGQLLSTLLHALSLGTSADMKLVHDTLLRKAETMERFLDTAAALCTTPEIAQGGIEKETASRPVSGLLKHTYTFVDGALPRALVVAAARGLSAMYSSAGQVYQNRVDHFHELACSLNTNDPT